MTEDGSQDLDPSLSATMSVLALELAKRGRPTEFSEDGLATLVQRQREYVEELGVEAIRLAQRGKVDVVSATHIDEADEHLRPPRRRIALVESSGGVLAGAGLGQSLQVLSAHDPTALAIGAAILLSVLGFALLTFGLARS